MVVARMCGGRIASGPIDFEGEVGGILVVLQGCHVRAPDKGSTATSSMKS
jgi:hypothetical protein